PDLYSLSLHDALPIYRQPEFTQLDIEMSFVSQEDVIALAEEIVASLWRELAGYEITTPLPRLTWHEAMERYGSDKPDLRFGVELADLTDYLRGTEFRVFSTAIMAGGYVGEVGERSEEHTSELQSRENLVCRLLLE